MDLLGDAAVKLAHWMLRPKDIFEREQVGTYFLLQFFILQRSEMLNFQSIFSNITTNYYDPTLFPKLLHFLDIFLYDTLLSRSMYNLLQILPNLHDVSLIDKIIADNRSASFNQKQIIFNSFILGH